jgi:hypothetical protein
MKFAKFVYICITRGKNNHFPLKKGELSLISLVNILFPIFVTLSYDGDLGSRSF